MYLEHQNGLPKPAGTPGADGARWRLHFEYPTESEEQAESHAAVCRTRQLRVKTDDNDRPVRRRLTIAVLSMSDDERKVLARFTGSTACSWTDTFDKETGRRTAMERLATRLKAGADERLSPEEHNTRARAIRCTYDQRPRYKPLREAPQLLNRVVDEAKAGESATVSEIRTFLKQFNY